MKIGEKIKKLREDLGYTQEQLAELMGYKSKSTINKIESGINDITQSKVIEFSKILKTTPAYLMGWDDNPTPPKPTVDTSMLTESDLHLIETRLIETVIHNTPEDSPLDKINKIGEIIEPIKLLIKILQEKPYIQKVFKNDENTLNHINSTELLPDRDLNFQNNQKKYAFEGENSLKTPDAKLEKLKQEYRKNKKRK